MPNSANRPALGRRGGGRVPPPHRPVGALDLSRYPNVYDAAFSWDRTREARSYLDVARSRSGKPPASAVELACGSGPLARRWASWGVEVYGVDRSRSALRRARELGRGIVPEGRWRVGELRSFRLPRKVDLAVVPLDSLGYLAGRGELIGFFRSARRSLVPGGVLAVDVTLHREGARPFPIRNTWKVSLVPSGTLTVRWHSHGEPWGTPPRQWEVARITARIRARNPQVFWEARPHAILSAPELQELADRAGGFGEMVVYSHAAHRARPVELTPVPSPLSAVGPRLVSWVAE